MDYKNQLKQIRRIANNALYFDDSSYYVKALWDILHMFDPDMKCIEDLDYMEGGLECDA